MIKKESGDKREFSTGAKRQHAEGKGTPVLFPGDAYLNVCKHFEDGAVHYGGRNWEKGLPLSSYIDSMERHIAQEKMGLTDESHDRAIAWNAICYLATKLRIQAGLLPKELDDLEGVYGKDKETVVDDCNLLVIKKASKNRYYVSIGDTCQYLWYDLKFHNRCCSDGAKVDTEGYFSTKEKAEKCLKAYLNRKVYK